MSPTRCLASITAAFSSMLLAASASAQTVWNLATDFSLASNPNGAWTCQMEVTPGDDDTAYTPINVQRTANVIWGTTFATSPVMQAEASGFWGIGRNDTGVTQTSASVTWAPGEVLFHPKPDFGGSGGRFVITWEAPGNMSIDVDWAYAKRMTIGVNGVGMGVLHQNGATNTQLRALGNPEGATGAFDNLAVQAGDKLHFRFDNWGDAGGDITWADITVTQLSTGGPSIASFTANPGTLADAGEAVTFNWEVGGVPFDSLAITPGNINVLPLTNGSGLGSYVLNPGPNGTTEYTLTAMKGVLSAMRRVTVTLPPPQITAFTLTPPRAAAGEAAQFAWQVQRPVTALVLTPGNIDLLAHTDAGGSGTFTLTPGPGALTVYTLTASRGTSVSTAQTSRGINDPNAIFLGDFESFTAPAGNFNGGQFQSGLVVAHSGNLTDWLKSGGGTVHVVDRANLVGGTNPRDFAVMIWQDNVITQATAVAGSNASGAPYKVSFEAGSGVYQAPSQATGSADGILIEILRADNSVLATHTHLPGVWAGYPTLAGGSFEYTGDGTGDVRLRIGPSSFNSGRFGGTIDNVSIAPVNAAPLDFTSISRNPATGAVTFSFNSINGVTYEVWATSNPPAWEQLDDEVVGTGSSTQFTDSFLAPTNARLFYQVRRP